MITKKLNWQNTIIVSPIICSAVMAILILLLQPFLPFKMPLFYSLAWGEQQLATRPQFLIIPALALSITLTNLMLSWHLKNNQILLKNILIFSSFVVTGILIISIIKIFFLFL